MLLDLRLLALCGVGRELPRPGVPSIAREGDGHRGRVRACAANVAGHDLHVKVVKRHAGFEGPHGFISRALAGSSARLRMRQRATRRARAARSVRAALAALSFLVALVAIAATVALSTRVPDYREPPGGRVFADPLAAREAQSPRGGGAAAGAADAVLATLTTRAFLCLGREYHLNALHEPGVV